MESSPWPVDAPAPGGFTMKQQTIAGKTILLEIVTTVVFSAGLQPCQIMAAEPTAIVTASRSSEPTSASSRRDDLVSVVERVKEAVVNIHSERTLNPGANDPFRTTPMQPQRVNGMGTGIVLDPRGYIVTNFHVVDDVHSLRVRLLDGNTCPARVLASDKMADLAVIKVEPPSPLALAPLGTAQDLYLAERVIAIGNAFGYEHTVTIGHVSAMKRDVTLNKEISYKSLIQTQTPINPGNSGGPLFNKLGEVVGVNVAIRAGAQNIAFAIPVDTMITRAADMLSVRQRQGLDHGLTVEDRFHRPSDDAPVRRWVRVAAVTASSPAAAAGIQPGDLIDRIGNLPIATSIDVERAFLDQPAGRVISVQIRRGATMPGTGTAMTFTVTLQPVAAQNPAELIWQRLGLRATPVGPEIVAQADRQLRGGLLIQEIAAGSPAARAGLEKGDVLIGLHLWESIHLENILFVLNHKDLSTFLPLKAFFLRHGKLRETVLSNLE